MAAESGLGHSRRIPDVGNMSAQLPTPDQLLHSSEPTRGAKYSPSAVALSFMGKLDHTVRWEDMGVPGHDLVTRPDRN